MQTGASGTWWREGGESQHRGLEVGSGWWDAGVSCEIPLPLLASRGHLCSLACGFFFHLQSWKAFSLLSDLCSVLPPSLSLSDAKHPTALLERP